MDKLERLVNETFGITPQRSPSQNNALHLGCELLADQLNDSGLSMQKVLRVDIPWTPQTVKLWLFKPIMKALLLKTSTTELNTKEVSQVWELLMRELGEKKGVEYIKFPSQEDLKN